MDDHKPVEDALGQLRLAIREVVRAEQLKDRLTGLPNDEAITEWLQERVDDGSQFWMAFVEVDRFKSVNDEYGYQQADVLLQEIAEKLQSDAGGFFPSRVIAARAHGDEFFLLGDMKDEHPPTAEHIATCLEQVRGNLALLRVQHPTRSPMQCTVSIGWLLAEDSRLAPDGLTVRSVRGHLELAVSRAKITRNAVERYQPNMKKEQRADGRADCGGCGAKFSVSVPHAELHALDQLSCPNCGSKVERPFALRPEPEAGDETPAQT